MTDAIWRAVAMLPGLPELGAYPTPLECAEAANYFAASAHSVSHLHLTLPTIFHRPTSSAP